MAGPVSEGGFGGEVCDLGFWGEVSEEGLGWEVGQVRFRRKVGQLGLLSHWGSLGGVHLGGGRFRGGVNEGRRLLGVRLGGGGGFVLDIWRRAGLVHRWEVDGVDLPQRH